MRLDRRTFLRLAAAGAVTANLARHDAAMAAPRARFRAIAFDGFPIFDPRPIFALAEQLFPNQGAALADAWRARQFEYQWLRALGGRYADFGQVTESALVFAAAQLHLALTAEKRQRLMQAHLGMNPWPDVAATLSALQAAGLRLALLSNMTTQMLESGVRNAALSERFEHILSTDRIRTYKPDPRAYQLAIDAFQVPREDILFVAFAGWDVAGAKWFGYPTFWVNRMHAPAEELGAAADGMADELSALVTFVNADELTPNHASSNTVRQ
jgi:2-haloacid dehalogenase